VIGHVLPLIDNIRLVDRLASDAAEEERRRIARDIHDSIIQPYVGIQLGLIGLQGKLAAGGHDVEGDIERLIKLTENGITDLRNYVSGLQDSGQSEGSLLPAVKRFAKKFSQATGLTVEIEANSEIRVNDRLAAEVFQMVAEAFSNVRRHTLAERVTTRLKCFEGQLVVRIENDRANGSASSDFTPRSITERALALGGQAHVEPWGLGGAAVVIEIPL
jgi:signal transduction histidine kinase